MSTDTPNDTARTTDSRGSGDGGAARLPGAAKPKSRSSSSSARPASRGGRAARTTPRRVRLSLSRVDPWSVFKIAFLLSVAIAIAGVVMMGVLWTVLSGMGVFDNLNDLLRSMDRKGSTFDLMDYIGFGRVMSLSVVVGVIDIFLMTAMATLGAFLYNICSSLVGGLHLTLTDE